MQRLTSGLVLSVEGGSRTAMLEEPCEGAQTFPPHPRTKAGTVAPLMALFASFYCPLGGCQRLAGKRQQPFL